LNCVGIQHLNHLKNDITLESAAPKLSSEVGILQVG
jgi:hypothetical protein